MFISTNVRFTLRSGMVSSEKSVFIPTLRLWKALFHPGWCNPFMSVSWATPWRSTNSTATRPSTSLY